jgi:hypothetical protein
MLHLPPQTAHSTAGAFGSIFLGMAQRMRLGCPSIATTVTLSSVKEPPVRLKRLSHPTGCRVS